jgi:hypothetical protein
MTPNNDPNFEQFKLDRHEALLSLDREKIRAYMLKYNVPCPPTEEMFWISVHKARTALLTLPRRSRRQSKQWLAARGYHSMDDGDLSEGRDA